MVQCFKPQICTVRPGTTWANEVTFVMNHASGTGSIAQPVDPQSSMLPLCYSCPPQTGNQEVKNRGEDRQNHRFVDTCSNNLAMICGKSHFYLAHFLSKDSWREYGKDSVSKLLYVTFFCALKQTNETSSCKFLSAKIMQA